MSKPIAKSSKSKTSTKKTTVSELPIDKIKRDTALHARCRTDSATVSAYAERMEAGDIFPPINVFVDKNVYFLADGWHRLLAARELGRSSITCTVQRGTKRDATLAAMGSNRTHGFPRSREDKHKVVRVLLEDREWRQWSDSAIAQHCGVSQPFVSTVRSALTQKDYKCPSRKTRDGRTMDTTNIGRRKKQHALAAPPSSKPFDPRDGLVGIALHAEAAAEPPVPEAAGVANPGDSPRAAVKTDTRKAEHLRELNRELFGLIGNRNSAEVSFIHLRKCVKELHELINELFGE